MLDAGVYTNSATGVVTARTVFPAGTYIIVPSTFEPCESDFTVTCFSKAAVSLRPM